MRTISAIKVEQIISRREQALKSEEWYKEPVYMHEFTTKDLVDLQIEQLEYIRREVSRNSN